MSSVREECRAFRAALLTALEGRPVPRELTALSWHRHLLSCGACRALLEREEALEELLSTMPDPKLPPDLTRRVLVRLRAAREENGHLDHLLDLAETRTPNGLAARVTAGVRNELALDRLLDLDEVSVPDGLAARVSREVALDSLLELDPPVEVPPGLVAGVLEAVEEEREEQLVPALPWYRQVRTPYLWAAAAGFLLLVLSPWLRRDGGSVYAPDGGERVAVHDIGEEADEEILDNLDVLMNETLWKEDLHLFLADEVDEVLLALLEDEVEGPGGVSDPHDR